jgi:hypothetical protein
MKGTTGALYLDEFQVLGVEGREHADTYPPLTVSERNVCDVIAAGLYLSKSSIQWAYFRAVVKKEKDAFRHILGILEHKPIKITVE